MRSSFVELSVEETGALLRAARFDSAAQIHEVLLAALAYALAHWSGHDTVQVMVLGHARYPVFDSIDLARTVGWLTIGTPMVLTVARDQGFTEVVQSIKTQCRQVPLRGLGHGVLERLSPYAAQAAALRAPYPVEVEFNYAGQSSSAQPASSLLRGHADEQVWQTEGLLVEPSSSLLGWKGMVRDGRLIMKCSYNEELLRHDTFERIMHHFSAALASLGTRK
jgi:non-ribosomal peptide synthase protein (TIGR01720 family)